DTVEEGAGQHSSLRAELRPRDAEPTPSRCSQMALFSSGVRIPVETGDDAPRTRGTVRRSPDLRVDSTDFLQWCRSSWGITLANSSPIDGELPVAGGHVVVATQDLAIVELQARSLALAEVASELIRAVADHELPEDPLPTRAE